MYVGVSKHSWTANSRIGQKFAKFAKFAAIEKKSLIRYVGISTEMLVYDDMTS